MTATPAPTVPTVRPDAGAEGRRALLLLLVYLVGCAVGAAVLATGLGVGLQELIAWAQPYLTPRTLLG